MATTAYAIREEKTEQGKAVLAWSEGLGLHVKLGDRLVGWAFSSDEIAVYQFEKLLDRPAGKEKK
jgi:hypothetical protein